MDMAVTTGDLHPSSGLAKAAHIEGGIDAWKKAGGPEVMG